MIKSLNPSYSELIMKTRWFSWRKWWLFLEEEIGGLIVNLSLVGPVHGLSAVMFSGKCFMNNW